MGCPPVEDLIIRVLGALKPLWVFPLCSAALPIYLISGMELLNFLLRFAADGAIVRVGVACFLPLPIRVLEGTGAGLEPILWRVLRCGVVDLLTLIVDKFDSEGDFLIGVVGYN